MDFNFEAKQITVGAIVILVLILAVGAFVITRQASKLARVVASPLAQPSQVSSPSPSPSPFATPNPTPSVYPVASASPSATFKSKGNVSGSTTVYYQNTVLYPTPSPVPFKVTSVTSHNSPGAFSGSCPQDFTFFGTITASGSGTVTYHWVRSDGSKGDDKTLSFSYGSSQNAETDSRNFGGSTSGWEKIKVTSPNDIESNQTSYSLSCY